MSSKTKENIDKNKAVDGDVDVDLFSKMSLTDKETKQLLSTPRPRRSRITKQVSDLSSLLSEPPSPMPTSPGSPDTPIGDTMFLAGRSPQGRRRLRVRQSSDLSGLFAVGPPLSSPSFDEDCKDKDVNLVMIGRNKKGPIFAPPLPKGKLNF
mmetsp:Transcript_26122/g.58062  ORF Transcript_26122/g.58062 Transcript_26122/m.58062 type:complete len:152 (-) Transcript_26122:326-781(-)